jgi:hypothetical protein
MFPRRFVPGDCGSADRRGATLVIGSLITTSRLREAHVTTPPDFGGREIEEGLLEDLGGPQEHHAVDHEDEVSSSWDDNEAHPVGKVCARCGAVIAAGEDARHRADGRWVHEACPVV